MAVARHILSSDHGCKPLHDVSEAVKALLDKDIAPKVEVISGDAARTQNSVASL